jgi:uncharacterized protein (TIGR00255 family)
MRSMTGFGKSEQLTSSGKWTAEVSSVNRRTLELSLYLPEGAASLEPSIRQLITAQVGRGHVTLRLRLEATERGVRTPSLAQMKALKDRWESLAQDLGYGKEGVTLAFLLSQVQQASVAIDFPLMDLIGEAVKELNQMREKEGAVLANDLGKRAARLAHFQKEIGHLAPVAVSAHRARLQEKMKDFLTDALQDRIQQEAALFAERIDVAEELTRIESHLSQLTSIQEGRKMEFLLQELLREFNTIASKASDAKISHLVVEAKGELEKMREQVQNIE